MESVTKYSDEFERFERSFNSISLEWVDDYDLDALSRLHGTERTLAVNLLIGRLAKGDPRAPRAIAGTGIREAIPSLHENLSKFRGEMLVEASMALYTLENFEGTKKHIVQVLYEDDRNDRLTAAYALRNFYSPEIVQALLFVAQTDADRDVRTTAAMSLLIMHKIMSSPFDMSQRDLLIQIDSDDKETKKKGITELYRLIYGPGISLNTGLPEPTFKTTGDPPADMTAGLTLRDQNNIRMVADTYGVKPLVRVSNEDMVNRIETGEVYPKPELVRTKTITDRDLPLGFSKDLVGLSACKQPDPPARIPDMTDSEWRELNKRYKQRLDEFQDQKSALEEMQAEGKITWDQKTGLITDAKTGKPFAGGIDVFGYVDAKTAKQVSPFTRNRINQELRALGITQHNEHLGWDYSSASDVTELGEEVSEFGTKARIDTRILNAHAEGGKPLNAYNPLTMKWETTWYTGGTQRNFVDVTQVGKDKLFTKVLPGRLK